MKKAEKEGAYDYPYSYVPQVVSKGMFIWERPGQPVNEDGEKPFMSFYVMPKYGRNLDSIFEQSDSLFSAKTVLMLGIKLLEILEKLHEAGYIYNDMKLDNILIGD